MDIPVLRAEMEKTLDRPRAQAQSSIEIATECFRDMPGKADGRLTCSLFLYTSRQPKPSSWQAMSIPPKLPPSTLSKAARASAGVLFWRLK